MFKLLVRSALVATIVTAAGMQSPLLAQQVSLTVFAAASMKNALDDANAAFTTRTGTKAVASYAATSALVRQIELGAPADIFVSADLEWMDYSLKHKLVRPATRIDLLGNRLVLVAPKNSKLAAVTLTPGVDLKKLVGDGPIVIGETKSVPAGRYAMAALQKLGIWPSVEKQMAMVENVRVALTLVARGEAELGIVYATDARVEPNVKLVGLFPPDSHPAIVYPVAATVRALPDAARYLDFLRSSAAKTVFEGYGFSFLVKPAL